MGDWPNRDARVASRGHGEFKARIYKEVPALLFIESSRHEAEIIARVAEKPVLCTEDNTMINPSLIRANCSYGSDIEKAERGVQQLVDPHWDPSRAQIYVKKHICLNPLCQKHSHGLSICIFSHSAGLSGAERSLLQLVTELIRDHGILCTVVLPAEGPLKKRLEEVGAATLIAGYSWWCIPPRAPDVSPGPTMSAASRVLIEDLLPVLEKINPDVFLTNTMTIPWGAVAAALLGKPHVWFVREFGDEDHGLKFFFPVSDIRRFIKDSSNLVLTNSDAVRASLAGDSPGANIMTVYMDIEVPSTVAAADGAHYFQRSTATKLLILGGVVEGKGQEDAILAVAELTARGHDVELLIVGQREQGYFEKLQAIVDERGLGTHVRFENFQDDPYPVIAAADVVLVCSRKEAFGRTALEAMLLGKPVIASNAGGLPEIVSDGITGFLYRPGDVGELANKIQQLIADPELMQQMGKRGQEVARRRFTPAGYGGRVACILMELKRERNPIVGDWSARLGLPDAILRVVRENRDWKRMVGALQTQLAEKEQAAQMLQAQLTEREQVLGQLQSQLDQLKAEQERLTQQLAEKEQVLKRQLEEREKALESVRRQLAEFQTERAQLISQVAEKEQAVQDLHHRLTWKRYRWADLVAGCYWYLRHPKMVLRIVNDRARRIGRERVATPFAIWMRRTTRYYKLGRKAWRILINQGPVALWRAFLTYRRTSKAVRQAKALPGSSSESFCLAPSDFVTVTKAKIAVVVHAYYVDVFEEICSYLKNIPFKFSLFVSVKDGHDRAIVAHKAKRLPHAEQVDIRVVPNRGRDIAPLLVEFGPALRRFDYILHLHTKKSLRTGTEQIGWRRYRYEMLVGSKERVRAILSVFEKDRTVGIVYSETLDDGPYWGHTWLSNKAIASTLLTRMGVRFDPEEYLDFPVGSMFWARREALEPLLDLRLTWDDFPEETGQTDGMLHHTIERCFVLAARSRGLRQLVLTDKNTHRFSYRSHRNLHHYISASLQEKLWPVLPQAKVVSFDIFDTLLIRPFADPGMVFSFLEERVSKEFGIKDYRRLRQEAENIARARSPLKRDVTISEIYSAFSELANINPSTAEKLLQFEVETEQALLAPRIAVVEFAREVKKSGKRLVLVSDTYLEKKYLERILQAKGIDFYDTMYISCEVGKRKDRGDLWQHVIEQEYVEPRELLHVGDNEQSDVQLLVDRGFMHPGHVMKPSVLFRLTETGETLWKAIQPYRGWKESLLYGMVANLFCSDPVPKGIFESKAPLSDPFKLGYSLMGPIVFTFLAWLIKMAQQDNIDAIKFTTREGYLLDKAYRLLATHEAVRASSVSMPEGSHLICSRRAVLFGALRTERDILRLLQRHFHGTLKAFFEKRLNIIDLAPIERRLGSRTLEEKISLPQDHDKVYAYVTRVFDILSEQARKEREALLQYCEEQGLKAPMKIGLVDLGYSGTVQKTLSDLLQLPLAGYYFVTDMAARELENSGLICRACFGEFLDPLNTDNPFSRYSLLLEAVLAAPTGQLVCFRQTPAGPEPVYKEPGVSQRAFATISIIHEGILRFIKDLLSLFGAQALDIEFPQDALKRCYEDIVTSRLRIGELEAVLSVEDQYCGNDEIPVLRFYQHQK